MLPFTSDYLSYLLTHPSDSEYAQAELPGGEKIELIGAGALVITPKHFTNHCKAIVLSAGIHGNETAPIEWLNQLLDDLLKGTLRTHHPLLLLFGHPNAMIAAKRELEFNLNRLFCGAWHQGNSLEHQRAAQLAGWMSDFYERFALERLHYDLHTAIRGSVHEKFAVAPYIPQRPHNLSQLAFLQHCDVNCVLFYHQSTQTFSYHSASVHDAQSFTVELGQVKPFGHNDLSRLRALDSAIRRLVTHVRVDWGTVRYQQCHWYQVTEEIIRQDENLEFNFADDLANFTLFEEGELLATQGGGLIRVKDGPKAVVFPNAKVAIGQRAAILVKAMSRSQCQHLVNS
ncbi:succinylglutamate desuccinylase [Celerinatantimonas diazotrophica]|uniref:Succinylglutamate desuccinylase n=1 Tax=Celerinatantimonas diazotrophica TaxID=412034 RepID=A0A4R1JLE4_9GAMM|nr:succinylglutamate desuccinylase [Celerinatantimonas diazotrophica]TCK51807.1 succinylglutamate desuccinylase [Celerinatantimonas diazotrophica]CAG9296501.1 Succinylglutamate desuccinylase [Celerinatantimonas diazotrophica]